VLSTERGCTCLSLKGLVVEGLPLCLPRPLTLLQDPEPGQVFEKAHRAVQANLVGKTGLPRRVGEQGRFSLHPEERPGAAAKVGPRAPIVHGRHGSYSAGCIVRATRNHFNGRLAVRKTPTPERSKPRCRRHDLRPRLRVDGELLHQIVGPLVGANIHELRRAGHRQLSNGPPTKPVLEVVGYREAPCSVLNGLRLHPLIGKNLVEGVDGNKLNACGGVDPLPSHSAHSFFHHLLRARIAITIRVSQRLTVCAERHVVDGPGVYRAAPQGRGGRKSCSKTLKQGILQGLQVPEETLAILDERRLEPMHLLHRQNLLVKEAEQGTPTGGTQIESKIVVGRGHTERWVFVRRRHSVPFRQRLCGGLYAPSDRSSCRASR